MAEERENSLKFAMNNNTPVINVIDTSPNSTPDDDVLNQNRRDSTNTRRVSNASGLFERNENKEQDKQEEYERTNNLYLPIYTYQIPKSLHKQKWQRTFFMDAKNGIVRMKSSARQYPSVTSV